MERATGSAIPAGHVCLLHGSKRGLRFVVAGASLCGLAIATMAALSYAGCEFARYGGAGMFAAFLGFTLFALGWHDVAGHRAFREAAAASRSLPAWSPERHASRMGEIRTTSLRDASPIWRWVIGMVLVTCVAAYALVPPLLGRIGFRAGGAMGLSVFGCVVVLLVHEVLRGKARGRVHYPVPCLLLGEDAEVLFQIDPGRVDLAPESIEFVLRCVQARPAFGGLLRTAEVVENVAPKSIRFVPGEINGWELTFGLRDDLIGADLLRDPPTYWELVVDMSGTRSAYHQAFLAPVFTRAQAGIPAGLPPPQRSSHGPPPLKPARMRSSRRGAAPAGETAP